MFSKQEMMSASLLLSEIRDTQEGADIRLPVMLNFDRTAQEQFTSVLKVLLHSKKPPAVVLYKFPEREAFDVKALAAVLEMLTDARIYIIKLDLRHYSTRSIEDLYQKTKRVLWDMTARPLIMASTMHNQDYWLHRFAKLINLTKPMVESAPVIPVRPASAPPKLESSTAIMTHALFAESDYHVMSASMHAGSLDVASAKPPEAKPAEITYDEPPPGFFDDEPPSFSLVEKPEPQPSRWVPGCSMM